MLPGFPYALVIDDDSDLCRLLNLMLQTKKVTAVCAGTLEEAKQLIAKKLPSLVFLDNYLPDGTGLEFLRGSGLIQKDIRVAMITGEASDELKEQAIQAGCNYFLEKPFSYLSVSKIVDDMVYGTKTS
jgi:two-component system response regulator PilR (NtrC family)/two-component system KDP operon response regulator KdpE